MTCQSCGARIADKALICYRCGEATTTPRRRPPSASPAPRRGRLVPAFVGLLLLAGAALFLGRASGDAVPPWAGAVVMAGVAAALIWRVLRPRE